MGLTRNAVMGKVDRLKLESRGTIKRIPRSDIGVPRERRFVPMRRRSADEGVELTKAELRRMLAEAVRNTAALTNGE
jgi:hypothetical protein